MTTYHQIPFSWHHVMLTYRVDADSSCSVSSYNGPAGAAEIAAERDTICNQTQTARDTSIYSQTHANIMQACDFLERSVS